MEPTYHRMHTIMVPVPAEHELHKIGLGIIVLSRGSQAPVVKLTTKNYTARFSAEVELSREDLERHRDQINAALMDWPER